MLSISDLVASLSAVRTTRIYGRVAAVEGGVIRIAGLTGMACVGEFLSVERNHGGFVDAEIIAVDEDMVSAMAYGSLEGLATGARAILKQCPDFAPCEAWLGHVVNAFGHSLDGRPLSSGDAPVDIRAYPPKPTLRRRLGKRLSTGLSAFDTMLPVVEGQRCGLFAGSGVGKSRLLGRFAQGMEADVVVVGLIGERGREVLEFVEDTIGAEGMSRCCVVAASSDEPAPVRRRAAWAAMGVAEYFRDRGCRVLLLFDSLTRFAEAHREIALLAGEEPSLSGFPPSVAPMIASLVERAGPGSVSCGADITAIFTVLVAGSDMEGPIADIVRGLLDGHVVLERSIAERGRFPAVDVLRSVSRSLPDAATADENRIISRVRKTLGLYEKILPMLQVGLYRAGNDASTDEAVRLWPGIDDFLTERSDSPASAFGRLQSILEDDGARQEPNDAVNKDIDAAGPKPEAA